MESKLLYEDLTYKIIVAAMEVTHGNVIGLFHNWIDNSSGQKETDNSGTLTFYVS